MVESQFNDHFLSHAQAPGSTSHLPPSSVMVGGAGVSWAVRGTQIYILAFGKL